MMIAGNGTQWSGYKMSNDNDDFTPEELLGTVLNIAAQAVDSQFHDETREALWVVLDACARAYDINIEYPGDTDAPPRNFPFKITDISQDPPAE